MAQNINQKNGLLGLEVSTVIKDNDQNIWVGTYEGGISKIDLKQNKIFNYTDKQGLRNLDITSMLLDRDGNLWVGTVFGDLFKLKEKNKTLEYYPNSGSYIVCIFEDKAGNIWYSSREKGEVLCINKKDNSVRHFSPKQGLPQNKVVRIWQDSNENMWFCTFNGVSKLNKDQTTLTNYSEKEGYRMGVVESIVEDRHGNFWFSTLSNGVWNLNEKNKTFLNLTEKDGLSNNTAFGILYDKKGNLWFNTRLGLSFIAKTFVDQLASKEPLSKPIEIKNYTYEQGYMGFGAGRFDILEDSSGKIWLPMLDRLTIFDPNEEKITNNPPNVEITQVKLFNEYIDWKNDTTYNLKNGFSIAGFKFKELAKWNPLPLDLKLPYDINYVSFEFVGNEISTPSKVIYQYFLEGLDNRWSIPSPKNEAIFGNLADGNYTFFVKAKIGDGPWSQQKHFDFKIKPPFWKTWWAYLVYIMVFSYIIYWLIQLRIERGLKRIRSLESIRTKISSDLHDDVGSILSGLAMQSQMLAYNAKGQLKENLMELSQMSQDAMERMRETVWAIDSRKDKYENLIDKMREYAEKNFHLKGIKHKFITDLADSKKFINPEKRQNIYLIFKEAVTNICKHSNATHVDIYIRQYNSHFILKISDNGTNFNNIKSEGLGMKNMKMRAKNIGFDFKAESVNGFTITLKKI
jgi:streptogramin lyase/two-component sensor histidine kinase